MYYYAVLQGCTKEEAVEYCRTKHGYLAEYQFLDEFELVRSTIKESVGTYWFWVGASNTEVDET